MHNKVDNHMAYNLPSHHQGKNITRFSKKVHNGSDAKIEGTMLPLQIQ